ncbi:MAG TPA: hypothetical protein VKC54_02970 [Patescibacteria group bacterium]|nr:hypothetical protein [Patescibacteria group bacterium]
MNTEEYLNNLKKEYEKTDATMHLKTQGWYELEKRIELFTPRKVPPKWFGFGAVCALIIFLFSGIIVAASPSIPGDSLYPVKLLSEKIVQKISGSNQIVIDHRAEEIIGLSKAREINKEALEHAVIEYKQYVDLTQDKIEKSGKSNAKFQNKLKKQHFEFDRVSRDNLEIKNEIFDAEKASDH